MSAVHIDGDLFTLENGAITRFVSGKNDGWEGAVPDDTLLRAAQATPSWPAAARAARASCTATTDAMPA